MEVNGCSDLNKYHGAVVRDVEDLCNTQDESVESGPASAFTRRTIDVLYKQSEVMETTQTLYFRKKIENDWCHINGIGVDAERGTLELVTTLYNGSDPNRTVRQATISKQIDEAMRFCNRMFSGVDPKTWVDAGWGNLHDLLDIVHRYGDQIDHINIHCFMDQTVQQGYEYEMPDNFKEKRVDVHVWDIERIRRIEQGETEDVILVDFDKQHGGPVDCLEIGSGQSGYEAYLFFLNGQVLHDLYEANRTRLLQDNVRYYLQSTGKINKQLIRTIDGTPNRFFAYNNGITSVAEDIDVVRRSSGKIVIRSILGWQIVNGGQTTSSIHICGQRNYDSLKDVFVPVKVIKVSSDDKGFSSDIARYSNSQNKIQNIDFYSNHPFLRAIEQQSRDHWITSHSGAGTYIWYFERTRGQWKEEKRNCKQKKDKDRFDRRYPKTHVFTKEDLAKAEIAWMELPYIASSGNEASFLEYVDRTDLREDLVTPEYYESIISHLILYREIDRMVEKMIGRDNKAQIVQYCVAVLSRLTEQNLDLGKIFDIQGLPGALNEYIGVLCLTVHDLLKQSLEDAGNTNLAMHCRKQTTWFDVASAIPDVPLPESVLKSNQMDDSDPNEWNALISWAGEIGVWHDLRDFVKGIDTSSYDKDGSGLAANDVIFLMGYRLRPTTRFTDDSDSREKSLLIKVSRMDLNIPEESEILGEFFKRIKKYIS